MREEFSAHLGTPVIYSKKMLCYFRVVVFVPVYSQPTVQHLGFALLWSASACYCRAMITKLCLV